MGSNIFKLERKSYVYIVTLDNPDNDNLMDQDFFIELKDTFEILDEDPEVRVVIINNSGEDFSLGLDLENIFNDLDKNSTGDENRLASVRDFVSGMSQGIRSIENCSKPVLAAVSGKCVGAGISIAAACDIRLMDDDSFFSLCELDKGIVLDAYIFTQIGRIIGDGFMREIVFTSQKIRAKKAAELGLVNYVYPDKTALFDGALELAEKIAGNSALCVQSNKEALNRLNGINKSSTNETILDVNTRILSLPGILEALEEKKK